MPNIKSAVKELRKSKRRAAVNKQAKNALKSLSKKTKKAVVAKSQDSAELLQKTLKALDKAAQKGLIKKNTRDRKKSRLQKSFNRSKQS